MFTTKEDSQETADHTSVASGSQGVVEIGDVPQSNSQSPVQTDEVTVQLSGNVIEIRNTKVEVMRAVLVLSIRRSMISV